MTTTFQTRNEPLLQSLLVCLSKVVLIDTGESLSVLCADWIWAGLKKWKTTADHMTALPPWASLLSVITHHDYILGTYGGNAVECFLCMQRRGHLLVLTIKTILTFKTSEQLPFSEIFFLLFG